MCANEKKELENNDREGRIGKNENDNSAKIIDFCLPAFFVGR